MDDLISRQAAIESFKPRGIAEDVWQECNEYRVLSSLPSVKPQATAHWIDREVYDADRWKCSECGRTEPYKENYCPNCGAKMFEPQERSE